MIEDIVDRNGSMNGEADAETSALMDRIDRLDRKCDELIDENSELREELARLEGIEEVCRRLMDQDLAMQRTVMRLYDIIYGHIPRTDEGMSLEDMWKELLIARAQNALLKQKADVLEGKDKDSPEEDVSVNEIKE